MSKQTQAVRGMNDLLPDTLKVWQHVESCAVQVLQLYGYREIRFPIVEKTDLFARSIGEVTDIVEKEMYSFEDRNGDSLSLRPEGTAGCVRAGIENGLLHNQIQRLWYGGPMFRHERPQKGRYRQFHQIGVETFGLSGPDIDTEILLLCQRLWSTLNVDDDLTLEINNIGTSEERTLYKKSLVNYLEAYQGKLDADSLRRLQTNPLRILDSKDSSTQTIIAGAPRIEEYLGDDSKQHFQGLLDYLENIGITYQVNANLVRGLDYYSNTVFEWTTDKLGAQGAVCAGGRYDTLVEQLGGKATPAMGMAIGMERLVALCEDRNPNLKDAGPHAYMVLLGEVAKKQGMQLAESLRVSGIRVMSHCGSGSMKQQMKQADKSGAEFALLLGEDEIKQGIVSVKYLREKAEQQHVSIDDIVDHLLLSIN